MDLNGFSRITFYGTLPQGEIFNWSLWMNFAPLTNADAVTLATQAKTAFTADPGVTMPPWKLIGSDANYVGVRAYGYSDHSGKANHIADVAISTIGSSGATSTLPNQCAVAVGLKTALAGRRHQGRVYLPLTKFGLSSGGNLDTATGSGLAAWMAAFISRINTAQSGGAKVGILSRVTGTPTFEPVTSAVCDLKVDIQRRRANRQTVAGKYTSPVV